jgi:hypothetical protein
MGATGGDTGTPARNCGKCNVAAENLVSTALPTRFGEFK